MKLKIFFVLILFAVIGFSASVSYAGPTDCFIGGQSDLDCDGIADNRDNCPNVRNGACLCPSVEEGLCVYQNTFITIMNVLMCDINGDGRVSEKEFLAGNQVNWNNMEPEDQGGDACEDYDGDGIVDGADNCKLVYNPDQKDKSKSGIGDACEDTDNDGILDYFEYTDSEGVIRIIEDNCLHVWNHRQEDRDEDEKGDACDPCPLDADDMCTDDRDKDGIVDWEDNCPNRYNPEQEDADLDEIGNVCDNCSDAFNPDQTDTNGNGVGDACDINKNIVEPPPAGPEDLQGSGGCNLNSSSSLFGLIMLIPILFRRRK